LPRRRAEPADKGVAGQSVWRAAPDPLFWRLNTGVQPMSDMPDFSNVSSGSSSTAEKIYEVKSGDSLSKIAKNEYGDANKWPQIFEANKDVLKDPNKIFPGQKLKIPPLG
jgi:nucleoid-associated protein YgaU